MKNDTVGELITQDMIVMGNRNVEVHHDTVSTSTEFVLHYWTLSTGPLLMDLVDE
jgi:hypothetical protein